MKGSNKEDPIFIKIFYVYKDRNVYNYLYIQLGFWLKNKLLYLLHRLIKKNFIIKIYGRGLSKYIENFIGRFIIYHLVKLNS